MDLALVLSRHHFVFELGDSRNRLGMIHERGQIRSGARLRIMMRIKCLDILNRSIILDGSKSLVRETAGFEIDSRLDDVRGREVLSY